MIVRGKKLYFRVFVLHGHGVRYLCVGTITRWFVIL